MIFLKHYAQLGWISPDYQLEDSINKFQHYISQRSSAKLDKCIQFFKQKKNG